MSYTLMEHAVSTNDMQRALYANFILYSDGHNFSKIHVYCTQNQKKEVSLNK